MTYGRYGPILQTLHEFDGYLQEPMIPLSDLIPMKDPNSADYYQIQSGDWCANCETQVVARWSGIACDCGGLWYCT